jgi:hypothetical protein
MWLRVNVFSKNRWIGFICLLVLVCTWFTVYILRLNQIAGLFIDDAYYVLLAKALATGQGYQLINLPSPSGFPVYPPVYPWLLSLIYRISPHFPNNITILKTVSVSAMFGVGLVSYLHLMRDREWPQLWALISAFTVTLIPAFVFFATSTFMTECLFTLLQLTFILVIERGVRAPRNQEWRFTMMGAMLASTAFLIRTIGIGLIVAAIIYLIKKRRWRGLATFTLSAVLIVGAWTLYVRLKAPTPEPGAQPGGIMTQSYNNLFWLRRAGDINSGNAGIRDLPYRVFTNFRQIVGNNLAMILVPTFYRPAIHSGEETLENGENLYAFSYLLGAVIALGAVTTARRKLMLAESVVAVSLGIIVLWPWYTFRFIIPLTPFIVFYLVIGVKEILDRLARREKIDMLGGVYFSPIIPVSIILSLFIFDHFSYLRLMSDKHSAKNVTWKTRFEEDQKALEWIRSNTRENAVIATTNPGMVYLYTNRKSVPRSDITENWENWRKLNLNYIAYLSTGALSAPNPVEARFNHTYVSAILSYIYIVDLGSVEDRSPLNPIEKSYEGGISFEMKEIPLSKQ